jgi:hypothetical protein
MDPFRYREEEAINIEEANLRFIAKKNYELHRINGEKIRRIMDKQKNNANLGLKQFRKVWD